MAAQEQTTWTVGQVAQRCDVTVRSLHHYDEIGLLRPSRRTASGYRLYDVADLTRLQHVVVYRRLGFALEEIALLLDDPDADVAAHLRRQRSAVMSRLDEMNDLVVAIDRALEAEMSGTRLTPEEQKELFGENFGEEYTAEAQERWGDTTEWAQSQQRTAQYTKHDWEVIAAEADAITGSFADAMAAGHPAGSTAAMDAAERHRVHVDRWFYDLGHGMHRGIADLYVTDERFARTYETRAAGLAAYVRDAVHANADRADATSDSAG